MTKRPCGMLLRFTRTEMDELTKKARKAHISRESFCRNILNGAVVKEAPPVDVPVFLNEIRRVGYNINQLLKIANGQELVDVPQLRKTLTDCQNVLKRINEAYAIVSD